MGLFDFFKGGSSNQQQAQAAPASPSQGIKARLEKAYELSEPQQHALYQELVQSIGSQIGQGQSRYNSNDDEAEWRGTYNNLPMRIKANTFPYIEGALKFQNPHGTVDLNWDPDYVQQPGDNDAWDEDDSVRIFVGKGVVIETFAWGIESELAGYKALPVQQMQELVKAMPECCIGHLYIRDGEIEWNHKDNAQEMADPIAQAARFAQLAGWAAAAWAAIPPDAAAQAVRQQVEAQEGQNAGPNPAIHRAKCNYCQATHLVNAQGTCPNCGAPSAN